MSNSAFTAVVDDLQKQLAPVFREAGFKVKGRTYNRKTDDALVQVVNVQMGASNPPGTIFAPKFRENFHGWFTVNLGVYVPEADRLAVADEPKKWVQEPSCSIRSRLGQVCGDGDVWWPALNNTAVLEDLTDRLNTRGFPFLEEFSSREKILNKLDVRQNHCVAGSRARIVCAQILFARGDLKKAKLHLREQLEIAESENNSRHASHVRQLAEGMGLTIE